MSAMRLRKRAVPVLAQEALEATPTKALLGRLRRLLRCEESPEASDASPEELAQLEGIVFKNTAEWRVAHDQLKVVLASREHVPKRSERHTTSIERARSNGTTEQRSRR